VTRPIHLQVDITGKVPIPGELHTAVTVYLPDRERLLEPPMVMFAYPGGGASRGMYCTETPVFVAYSQARWHAERGAVFVACDHLGTGDSSHPDPELLLTPEPLAIANMATAQGVLALLAANDVDPAFGPLQNAVRIAMGHSMGGGLLIILQGQQAYFDGIAVLGSSAFHTALPAPPGWDRRPRPHPARNSPGTLGVWEDRIPPPEAAQRRWMNRWDEQEAAIMREHRDDWIVPLASRTMPPAALTMNSAGYASEEASRVQCPVFIGYGERDVGVNPWEEPRYYWRARDVQLAVIPRMSHGMNSASTREQMWQRLHHWATGVATWHAQEPLP
jgi:alpha-beta hydrolase superfamily lysophospholipase